MNDSSTVLQVSSLTKTYKQGDRDVRALSDLHLTVNRGESVAIMGASGSGKSTLLHLIAGLTRPDSGEVVIDGQSVFSLSDSQLTKFRRDRIGLVFQSFNLVPALTAEDNILLPLLSGGKRCDSSQLEELLDHLGIEHRRFHRPDALSGGEQQRVAIARALITQPAIVLADEPTGSLDSQNSQAICELLHKISEKERRTIVTVTHEPSVAIYSNVVVVLKDGKVVSKFETGQFADSVGLAAHYLEVVSGQTGELEHTTT
ncbi:Lipoprotein-releasing system ATP-binding protein LolD [Pirellula sp. SH-Sr6A]|uniref:ABC transporter ATP-binding protein n=1 Tax=Pirellula sp. SH-Sr6A TaxID=1632865 RepID=UPI00078DF274|nr:ABC transporter ATP-binding protein [Pirellula sp. SH-Sr6A]AMV31551.1 Lipoprotein-releasing system ATP-binding protein LolD [Pirellula sp. SH-Sr6A]